MGSFNRKPEQMKAAVYQEYGTPDVLHIQDIPKPVPGKNEVLIKVHATSVTAGDWRLRKADPFLARFFNGLFKPARVKVLGFEVSGIIEQVGDEVASFGKGDAVFAFCGLKFGGYAEYCCLSEKDVVLLKPTALSFIESAVTPLGSLTALFFLKKAAIKEGDKALIYGASGSVGTFAVQMAKHFGAEITAVCSGANIDLVKSLGANKTVDYTNTNISELEEQFDIVFDAVGKTSKSACRKIIKPNGRFVSVKSQTKFTKQDLQWISNLATDGKLKPVIDRVYSLDEIQQAHRYVEQFHKKGNVAVRISNEY